MTMLTPRAVLCDTVAGTLSSESLALLQSDTSFSSQCHDHTGQCTAAAAAEVHMQAEGDSEPGPKPGLKLCGAGPQSLAVMPCIRKHSVLQLSNNTSVRVVSKLGAGGFGAAYRVTKMHPVPPDSCKATATAGHGNAKPAAARGGDLVVKLQRGSCAREYYLLRLVTRRVTLGC